MPLTATQVRDRVKNRTGHTDNAIVMDEVNSAKDWVFNRIFNSENGPDLLGTWATEITLASRTRDYDLGAGLSNVAIYGIKQLWVKLPTDSRFTPMVPADANARAFVENDSYPASDTTTVATSHPVYYETRNFDMVRFAPPLPVNAVLRVDYWRKAPDLDTSTNNTLDAGDDIPEPALEALVDKATAQVFILLDDSRWTEFNRLAEQRMHEAGFVLHKRAQGPARVTPYQYRRRRIL